MNNQISNPCPHESTIPIEVLTAGGGVVEGRVGNKELFGSRSMNITATACTACGAISLRVTHPACLRNFAEAQKKEIRT